MSTIEELPWCRYENAQKLFVKNHNILKQAGQIFSIKLRLDSLRLMWLARWAEIWSLDLGVAGVDAANVDDSNDSHHLDLDLNNKQKDFSVSSICLELETI